MTRFDRSRSGRGAGWLLLGLLVLAWSPTGAMAEGDPPSAKTVKILSHNVWYGFTKKGTPRHENWRTWMKDQQPDIVSLQELNGYTAERLAADGRAWGHAHSVLLKEDGFATGLTSKTPITDIKRIREGLQHGLLRCRTAGLWIFVIHFHPSNFAHRITEASLLKDEIAALGEAQPRVILAGDFNGFSPADRAQYNADLELVLFFRMLDERNPAARNLNANRIDYGGVEAILSQGFIDTLDHLREPGKAFAGTFPTPLVRDENHGTDRRLDYIFISPNLLPGLRSAKVLRDETTALLSDHYPVAATLQLEP